MIVISIDMQFIVRVLVLKSVVNLSKTLDTQMKLQILI